MSRLYEAAEALKGIRGQSDVARILNASPQTLNNWELRGMSKAGMIKAQTAVGCSATWLETGVGPMAFAAGFEGAMRIRSAISSAAPSRIQIKKVAELKLSAGITGFAVELDDRDGGTWEVPARWIEKNKLIPERLIAIDVKGESMEPSLYEGDLVVVNTADTSPVNGQVYAVNYEGEAVIKRLVREGGQWWLQSDNQSPRYPKRMCRGTECIIVGRVVRRETDQI